MPPCRPPPLPPPCPSASGGASPSRPGASPARGSAPSRGIASVAPPPIPPPPPPPPPPVLAPPASRCLRALTRAREGGGRFVQAGEELLRQRAYGLAAAECFREALADDDAGISGAGRSRALFGLARCAVEHVANADPFALRAETLRALLRLLSDVQSQLARALAGGGAPAAAAASEAGPSPLQLVALLRDAAAPLLRGGHFRFALEHMGYAVRTLEVLGLAQDPGHLAC